MPKIFISYRRDDSAYVAGMLRDRLEERFGVGSVFLDIDNIPLGVDFRDHINSAVGQCNILVSLIGDSWIGSTPSGERRIDSPTDFVRLEIESALTREIPVIPVLINHAEMPSAADLPPSLQSLAFRNAAEVRAGRDLKHHLELLLRGIDALLRVPAAKKRPPVLNGTATPRKNLQRSPWRAFPLLTFDALPNIQRIVHQFVSKIKNSSIWTSLITLAVVFLGIGVATAALHPLTQHTLFWELIGSLTLLVISSAVMAFTCRAATVLRQLVAYETKLVVMWLSYALSWAGCSLAFGVYTEKIWMFLSDITAMWWFGCAVAGGLLTCVVHLWLHRRQSGSHDPAGPSESSTEGE